MKTLAELKEHYNLNTSSTGGGCYAWTSDLNTLQDQIMITGDECDEPSDHSESYDIGIYSHKDNEQIYSHTTDNVPHLIELVDAAYTLWGN